ncbi:MAG: 4-alpha-glucanotransferase [Hyphomicrobiales bacterium]|nr:4-alpha-glucanotransferase [Hyphomicrobiales bacterium]
MRVDDHLNALAKRTGIVEYYHGYNGEIVETNQDTKKALLRANGFAVDSNVLISESWHHLDAQDQNRFFPEELIVQCEEPFETGFGAGAKWQILFEEQESLSFEGSAHEQIILPPLPMGIGTLTVNIDDYTQAITLICAPVNAPTILDLRGRNKIWGLNTALYGLRSKRNQGLGDYRDIATLSGISANAGADFIGLNPVHSIGYSEREIISPYSPSHRGFLDIRHIALDHIKGLQGCAKAKSILADSLEQVGRLRGSKLVDYDLQRKIHHQKLEALYAAFVESGESDAVKLFHQFCRERGQYLENFCLYEAISEVYGSNWLLWPANLREKDLVALNEMRGRLAERISFHSWLQWIADFQICDAQQSCINHGMAFGLYLDLAVGVRHGGGEEWCEMDTIAGGVSLGAPPDMMNIDGQNWNISGYSPRKLRIEQYRDFRQILKEAMRHCGILRIDHILGFFRSFWIPDDGSPGGYIKQPLDALLALVAIEAKSSNTIIIGEDLGLVPEGFREKIQEKGIYGYSVLQFEKDQQGGFVRPDNLRIQSLACFGTHDTPTLTGYWNGTDIEFWKSIGVIDSSEAINTYEQRRQDVNTLMGLQEVDCKVENLNQCDSKAFTDKVHGVLASSSAAMVSIQLGDILGEAEAQNYPGTVDQYPNWRKKCSKTLEEIDAGLLLEKTGECMNKSGRGEIQHMTRESAPR